MNAENRRWKLFDDHSRYVDRFGLLLAVTALAAVTLSLIDLGAMQQNLQAEVGQVVVSIFVGATLLLALRSSGVGRRLRILADIVLGLGVFATIVLALLVEFTDQDLGTPGAPSVAWVVLSVLAPIVVIRRLLHHKRASVQTLLGALSAYLLIALAFNFAFLTVDAYDSTPFFGEAQPSTSFMYFSLVTITTLGYGDLSAVEPFGRLLSTIEAVVGQVYLVTFVAMIVGLMVAERRGRVESDREP